MTAAPNGLTLTAAPNGLTLLVIVSGLWGTWRLIRWANSTAPQRVPTARTEVTDPRAIALARPRLTVIKGGRDEQVYDWEASGT